MLCIYVAVISTWRRTPPFVSFSINDILGHGSRTWWVGGARGKAGGWVFMAGNAKCWRQLRLLCEFIVRPVDWYKDSFSYRSVQTLDYLHATDAELSWRVYCVHVCVSVGAKRSEKLLIRADGVNVSHGEPPCKWLNFGGIWPWRLTLGATFVLPVKRIAYNMKTNGHILIPFCMVMYRFCDWLWGRDQIYQTGGGWQRCLLTQVNWQWKQTIFTSRGNIAWCRKRPVLAAQHGALWTSTNYRHDPGSALPPRCTE